MDSVKDFEFKQRKYMPVFPKASGKPTVYIQGYPYMEEKHLRLEAREMAAEETERRREAETLARAEAQRRQEEAQRLWEAEAELERLRAQLANRQDEGA